MRDSWLGTALLLVALYSVAPVAASTIPGLPAQTRLEAELSGGIVVLVKKNKRKNNAQRHGLGKKLRRHSAYRQRGAIRHLAQSPLGPDFVIIVPMEPNGVVGLVPRLHPLLAVPDRRRALRVRSFTAPDEPYLAGPAPTLPDENRSLITGGSAPSTAALSRITCDQAAAIVRDFGFSEVQAQGCSGVTYDFAATRDGQSYRIRMQSSDGELTEVRRQ